jgi:uncharacterized membrane protein YbhN (UPF0104 family)
MWSLLSRPAVRVAAAAAVLGVVLLQVGHGPFVAGVRSLDASTLLLGALLAVPATLAGAWRWRVVAAALDAPVDTGRAVAACYCAQLLNATLPTGVAGDVHRGFAHAPEGRRLTGLRTVAWERAAGQVVQVAVLVTLLVLLPSPLRPAAGWVLLVAVLAAGTVVASTRRWRAAWDVLRDDVRRLRTARVLSTVVTTSLLAQSAYVATGVLAARAAGVTAPLATLVPLVLVVLVAMAVPLGVAGWGPREGAAAWSFAAAGLGAGAGVATAVAYGVIATVAALPGLVPLALLARGTARRALPEEVARG